jgi:putative aldouronate transport system permease protein
MKQEKPLRRRSYFVRYWQLYAMMVLPLLYFLVFKYVPMLGSVLAFRRYRPGMGLFGTEWVALPTSHGSGRTRPSGGPFAIP